MVDTESNYRERADTEEGEETNLIDVADVSEALAKGVSKDRDEELKIAYQKAEPSFSKMPVVSEATIAKLSDRFAAFCIDTIIFFYLYLFCTYLYRRIIFGSWLGPFPLSGFHLLVFNGSFLAVVFLYYFAMEGIFFATFGKFLCRLMIRRSDGGLPSMLAIFTRNVFRIVDYLLFGFIAMLCMELTRSSQRLGDIIAGTTVLKKGGKASKSYHVSAANIATASGRTIAFFLDLIVFMPLITGVALMINPDRQLFSQCLILILPLIPLIYFTLLEIITETTPGKLVFGYIISFEDGNRLNFGASLIRTLMRPIDLVTGIVTMALSPKRQRMGDLCSGIVVTRQRRTIKGLVGLIAASALGVLVAFAGWQNPKSFLSPAFEFNFFTDIGWGPFVSSSQSKELALRNFRFAVGDPKNIRTPAVYSAGEKAYFLFEVSGYKRDRRKVWLQEDLSVRYPDLTIGLKQDNIIDYNKVVISDAPIELVNEIELPRTSMAGQYSISVTLRDMFSGKNVSEHIPFNVRPPIPETLAVPTVQTVPTAPIIPVAPTAPATPALTTTPVPAPKAPPPPATSLEQDTKTPAYKAETPSPVITSPALPGPLPTTTPIAPSSTPPAVPSTPSTVPSTSQAVPSTPPAIPSTPSTVPSTPPTEGETKTVETKPSVTPETAPILPKGPIITPLPSTTTTAPKTQTAPIPTEPTPAVPVPTTAPTPPSPTPTPITPTAPTTPPSTTSVPAIPAPSVPIPATSVPVTHAPTPTQPTTTPAPKSESAPSTPSKSTAIPAPATPAIPALTTVPASPPTTPTPIAPTTPVTPPSITPAPTIPAPSPVPKTTPVPKAKIEKKKEVSKVKQSRALAKVTETMPVITAEPIKQEGIIEKTLPPEGTTKPTTAPKDRSTTEGRTLDMDY